MKLPAHVPGEAIVRLRPGRSPALGEVVERFDLQRSPSDLVRLQLPAGMSTADGLERLSHDPNVEYAVPNQIHKLAEVPDDHSPEDLWGLETIHAPAAWEKTTGSRTGPIVAVIDTGTDITHPDLVNNLWTNPGEIPDNGVDDDGNGVVDDVHGYDAITNTGNPIDDYGHGTHCAGTIAAEGNNGQGVTGVNWQAQLMPIKFMDAHGEGTTAALIRGVLYAERMGATISSNSYGGEFNRAEFEVFRHADHMLHLCAAGNEGRDNDVGQYYLDRSASYPATYNLDQVVSVAASSKRERLASFSCYGKTTVDLAAPGTAILSTVPGGGYETKSGTSMATPHVAGVAALIATMYPESTPAQLKARLLNSVDPIDALKGQCLTGGRLNAEAALAPSQAPPAPEFAVENVSWRGFDVNTQVERPRLEVAGERYPGTRAEPWPSGAARELEVSVRAADWAETLSEPTTTTVSLPAATVAHEGFGEETFTVPREARVYLEGDFDLMYGHDELNVEVQKAGEDRWQTVDSLAGRMGQHRFVLDLSKWEGQSVRLRCRQVLEGPGSGAQLQRLVVAGA